MVYADFRSFTQALRSGPLSGPAVASTLLIVPRPTQVSQLAHCMTNT